MKKTKQITRKITETITTDVKCNKCGSSCLVYEHTNLPLHDAHRKVFEGLIEQEVHGGYDSKLLGDMHSYRFSLCEKCLVDLFKSFKIPVEVKTDYTQGYIPETKLDQALKEYNESIAQMNKDYEREKARKKLKR